MTKEKAPATAATVPEGKTLLMSDKSVPQTHTECQEDTFDLQEELKRVWNPKASQTRSIARRLALSGEDRRAERLSGCADWLTFAAEITQDGELMPQKLLFACFCKDPLCPMCGWRKSLRTGCGLRDVLTMAQISGYKLVFATFTIKNTKNLTDGIYTLKKGIRALHNKSRRFQRTVKGSFYAIEYTFNKKTREFHPHIHAILAVDGTYCPTSPDYITTADLVKMWRTSCHLDYDPICDLRIVKPNPNKAKNETSFGAAVLEVAKYAVKGSDLLALNLEELAHVSQTMKRQRMTEYTGVLRDLARIVCHGEDNFDDEGADLIGSAGRLDRNLPWLLSMFRYYDKEYRPQHQHIEYKHREKKNTA